MPQPSFFQYLLDHAPSKPIRVLGIDLGTTNSTITEITWNPGGIPCIRCLEVDQKTLGGVTSHVLVPSVVVKNEHQVLVGMGAKELRTLATRYGLEQGKNLFFETKNDIGTRKSYPLAPEGFQNAVEIAGHVLRFLMDAAHEECPTPPDRVVVTVPASFQAAQRQDTLCAATDAGIRVSGGDLLDEPVAAFVDYLMNHGEDIDFGQGEPKNLLAFDFGGGTCDIAIFQIRSMESGLAVSPLSVSRYHRLGGGDIDAAIVEECLIPQLCEQNGLEPWDLSYKGKKKTFFPALLGVAEALKIKICQSISRYKAFDKYEEMVGKVIVKHPEPIELPHDGKTLRLNGAKLTAEEFEELLVPFLDPDFTFAKDTEYRTTCSIFAPLSDALHRAGLSASEIDLCLLVGGSSLIPKVGEALDNYFEGAKLLVFPDRDAYQTAISKGAAWHALALTVMGTGLIQPVCHDRIAIRTDSGELELIPRGALLPVLNGACRELAVGHSNEVRVEVVTGEGMVIFSQTWVLPPTVEEGEPLVLEYRIDENQVLTLKLRLDQDCPDEENYVLNGTVDNPLTAIVNPNQTRIEIEEWEEKIRSQRVPPADIPDALAEIGRLCREIRQYEKAAEMFSTALRLKNLPDPNLLNQLALVYGSLGDHQREVKYYREATRNTEEGFANFNFALALRRHRDYEAASNEILEAIERETSAPFHVLYAQLAKATGDESTVSRQLAIAQELFEPIPLLDDWELGWYIALFRLIGDQEKVREAEKEKKHRERGNPIPLAAGEFPVWVGEGRLR